MVDTRLPKVVHMPRLAAKGGDEGVSRAIRSQAVNLPPTSPGFTLKGAEWPSAISGDRVGGQQGRMGYVENSEP